MGWYFFDSVQEFAKASRNTPSGSEGAWAGGYHKDAADKALFGDESLVAKAEALLAKIDAAVPMPEARWEQSPFGAYPVVPEFLAGFPDPMRLRKQVVSDVSPVTVWCDLNCYGGLSAEQMLTRGVAILALVMKLQEVRPVQLNICCALPARQTRIVVRVNSQPLDLSTAAFALARVGFTRNLMFGYARFKDKGWTDRIIDTEKELRRFLEAPDKDVVLRGAHAKDPILADPIGWVNAQVERFASDEEEQEFVTDAERDAIKKKVEEWKRYDC